MELDEVHPSGALFLNGIDNAPIFVAFRLELFANVANVANVARVIVTLIHLEASSL